jgi:flavin-dependent dehydrogenase
MKDSFDVIIIGAGPAGLECAYQFKDSKLQVLLIDKKEKIGPKYCAGGVKDTESIVDIPEKYVKRFDRQYSIVNGKEITVKLYDQFKCFEREDFGQYQLGKLKDLKNVTVLNPCLVTKIAADQIETNKGTFKFKYLVGADGSYSMVRRFLDLPSKCCMGLYYNIKMDSKRLVSYYDPKTIKTSYIWEFPHKIYNNVGIYFDPKFFNAEQAKKYLQEYCDRVGYQWQGAEYAGALINYDYRGYCFGAKQNIFVIGDAGGFASRLHGGGMSNGMASGRDVARRILDPGCATPDIDRVLGTKKQEERLLDLAEKLPAWLQTVLLNLMVRFFSNPGIQKRVKII